MGVVGVVGGVGLVLALSLLAGSGTVRVSGLGDREFRAGQVGSLASAVARAGPVAFPDASPRRERDIYVQHRGDSQEAGWLAFSAQAPGAPRQCLLRWSAAEDVFVDPCDGRRYAPDGAGLTRYPTRVEDGILYVDLQAGPTTTP